MAIAQCTTRLCAALGNVGRVGWTPERDESQGSDRLLRGTTALAGCGGTHVPLYPGNPGRGPSRCARSPHRVVYTSLVQGRAQQIPCLFVEKPSRSRPSTSFWHRLAQRTTRNASSRPLTSPAITALHALGPHCMTLSNTCITLHYTSTTPSRLDLSCVCLSSACQAGCHSATRPLCYSVTLSVSSRLWYHPIPPASALPSVP